MTQKSLTRRRFLIALGAVSAGTVLASCSPSAPTAQQEAAPPTEAPKKEEPTKAPEPPKAEEPAAPEATAAPTEPAAKYKEAPELAEKVKQGSLPPVDERLPLEPFVSTPLEGIGKYGGVLSSIVADPTGDLFEIDMGTGQTNIATRSMDLKSIIPNMATSWELSDDAKEIAIHMREGLKWSDGQPLTTEDVSFWYEDVLLNDDLTPTKDTRWMPGGEMMKLVVDDDYNFRFQFAAPHPVMVDYLPNLAPWEPKHYLSQWHIKYNDKADELAKTEGFDTWVQAYQFHEPTNKFQQDNQRPGLGAWLYDRTDTVGNRYYVRNPYFWRVDTEGNQLPYVNGLERMVVENKEVLTAKILAGEGTHHSWFLSLANYPLYKEHETDGGYNVGLYPDTRAAEFGFCFNYTHKDEVLRTMFNDLRWRQAASHAINRAEINELRFAGLGVPRNPIMDPGSSFFEEGLDQYYTEFNVDKANELLDEMGLAWDAAKKWRLRPDGKAIVLTMEVDAGRADLAEICNLIKGYWEKIGINLNVKPQDQQFFMQRMVANEHDIGVWAIGGSSEVYSRTNEPIRYRPPWHWSTTPLGGPLWRQWIDTDGKEGLEPPEVVKDLWQTTELWRKEPYGTPTYHDLGLKMLTVNAENAWCIGTVGLVPRPAIIKKTVRNAPKPGAVLSIEYNMWEYYQFDQWWIEA